MTGRAPDRQHLLPGEETIYLGTKEKQQLVKRKTIFFFFFWRGSISNNSFRRKKARQIMTIITRTVNFFFLLLEISGNENGAPKNGYAHTFVIGIKEEEAKKKEILFKKIPKITFLM